MSKFVPAKPNDYGITEEEQRKLLDEFSMDLQASNATDILNVKKIIETVKTESQFNNKKNNDINENPNRYENKMSDRLEIKFDDKKNEVLVLLDDKVIKSKKVVVQQLSKTSNKNDTMRTMTFGNSMIFDGNAVSDGNKICIANLLEFGDGYVSSSLEIHNIPKFINDVNSDFAIVDRALVETLYVTFRNYIPQAIFRAEDFQTRIDSLISDYDQRKYFFYEEEDGFGSKYVLCYTLDNNSLETLQDVMDILIGDNRILTWFGRVMQTVPPALLTSNEQILKFLNSSENQQDQFVDDILADPNTAFRSMDSKEPSILSLVNVREFSTLEPIHRIMEKVDGNEEEAKEMDEVEFDEEDDGIVRFAKDSE